MKSPRPHAKTTKLRQEAEEIFQEKAIYLPEIQERLMPESSLSIFNELRVHQIQLERQNEELKRIQGELEASQARYFNLY